MTTKTISGTITGGYTLSSAYTGVSVTSTGLITGAAGAYGQGYGGGAGGAGLTLPIGGRVSNGGLIAGGAGGDGGSYYYSKGGAGGVGVVLFASGKVVNSGSIVGGAGGHPGAFGRFGTGGAGGAGVVLEASGAVTNSGAIAGGAGAAGYYDGYGGAGGAGVEFYASGTVTNSGTITGGAGGNGLLHAIGAGGAGVAAAGGIIANNGLIVGGVCGNLYEGHGMGGAGVVLSAAGTVENNGTIAGGAGAKGTHHGGVGVALGGGGMVVNGSKTSNAAKIAGLIGIYAISGSTTVTNFGTIVGRDGVAVQFNNGQDDRLIVETGSAFVGVVHGGGGTLEVASGADVISGAKTSFTGFGSYQIDARAVLEVSSSAAANLTATFDGASATLALKEPANFAATIAGLSISDTFDLLKIAATGASVNGNDQLVIVDGKKVVATLQLTGSYAGATFNVASDGNGGTNITLAAASPSSHAFVAAMAGLGTSAASLSATSAPAVVPVSTSLLTPRGG